MGAHEELNLIVKIVDENNLRLAKDAGIDYGFFKTNEGQSLWKYINDYYNSREGHGELPPVEYLKRKMPTVKFPDPSRVSLDMMIKDFRDSHTLYTMGVVSDMLASTSRETRLDKVLYEAIDQLSDLCKERRVGKDIEVSNYMDEARAQYESFREAETYRGIPYPWEPLNIETQGMQDGELIIFYGRPKSMKTWVLLSAAIQAYDYSSRRVLIYSREMTQKQMLDRCVCMLINAPYSAYKKGELHTIPVPEGGTMEDRWRDLMDNCKRDENTCKLESGRNKGLILACAQDLRGSSIGVTGLKQKISDHMPDLVCVDAAYLLKNDRSGKRSVKWDEQAELVQDLKELALEINRPVIITTQANRDTEDSRVGTMANIAFADAYGMNCDLCIQISKKPTANPEHNELALEVVGSREVNMIGFAINGDAATDFGMMHRKVRNEEGVVLTGPDGQALMEPLVFYRPKDVKDFFKDHDPISTDGKQRSKGPFSPPEMVHTVAKKYLSK